MQEFGSGSRAVVQVFWDPRGGHVFNIENVDGRIVAVDSQVRKIVDLDETLSLTKTGSVNLIRTDNLRISERAKRFVNQRK